MDASGPLDFDGVYGAQCADLFKRYNRDLVGAPDFSFGGDGGAYRLWDAWSSYPSSVRSHDTQVAKTQTAVKGDVAVFSKTMPNSGGFGHVAVVLVDQGSNLKVIDQNAGTGALQGPWNGDSDGADIHLISKTYLSGYLRPTNLSTAPAGLSDGQFVRVSGSSAVFRIAGGAPIYISSWDDVGGPQPVTVLSQAAFDALRDYPRDGTFVTAQPGGHVFRFAGGAPFYVSSWSDMGGQKATVTVSRSSIEGAGGSYPRRFVRRWPANRTLVSPHDTGGVYVVAGGALFHFGSSSAFTQAGYSFDKVVELSHTVFERVGSGWQYPWGYLRQVPVDRTLLRGHDSDAVYVIAGGARLKIGSPAALAGAGYSFNDVVNVQTSRLNALPTVPADGTLLRGHGTDTVYVIAGGAAIRFTSRTALEAAGYTMAAVVNVDAARIAEFAATPENGTVLRSHDDPTRHWLVENGHRRAIATATAAVVVDAAALAAIPIVPGSAEIPNVPGSPDPTPNTNTMFRPVSPVRVFDTRSSSPQGAVAVDQHPYGGGRVLRVKVAGVAGVPASGAGAVSLNVTVTQPAAAGFVTVYPCGERPLSSNLNYSAGQTVPNAVIAPLSPSGEVCFYSLADTHLIADINGWFTAALN